MATIIRASDKNRQMLGYLPEHANLTQQTARNDVGALSGTYPSAGFNSHLFSLPIMYLSVVEDGVVQPDWYIYEDDTNEDDTHPHRPIQFTARGLMAMLEWAVVYPGRYNGVGGVNGLEPVHRFAKCTPGTIMLTLIEKAKTRGALDDLSYSFTHTHDSEGVAWPQKFDISYPTGQDYLSVLNAMMESGWVDAYMTGFSLKLVRGGQGGVDRPDIVYRLGKDVQKATRSRSRRTVRSNLIGVGAEKLITYKTDADALNTFGRREGSVSDGRYTRSDGINWFTQHNLGKVNRAKDSLTIVVPMGDDRVPGERLWRPGQDFRVGDFIRYSGRTAVDGVTPERLRVETLSFQWETKDSAPTCTIEFGDVNSQWTRKVTRTLGDAVGNRVNLSGTIPAQTVTLYPGTQPKPPRVVIGAIAPLPFGSTHRGSITATVTRDALNEDDSDAIEPSRVEYQWRYGSTGDWSPLLNAATDSIALDSLEPGKQVTIRARTVLETVAGPALSDWAEATAVAPADTTPPPVLAAPTLTARLGAVTVTTTETAAAGGAMPADYSHAEVHVGTAANFVTSDATVAGSIRKGAKTTVVTDRPYGVVHVKLVAVDVAGNKSGPSAAASVNVRPVVNADLIEAVLGAANIGDNAITADKLAANAVTARSLAALSVEAGKLAANAVTADAIAAGAITASKIAAGSVTANTLSADAVDGKTITGATLRTDDAGERVEVVGGTASTDNEIRFFHGTETNSYGRMRSVAGSSGRELGVLSSVELLAPGQMVRSQLQLTGGAASLLALRGTSAEIESNTAYAVGLLSVGQRLYGKFRDGIEIRKVDGSDTVTASVFLDDLGLRMVDGGMSSSRNRTTQWSATDTSIGSITAGGTPAGARGGQGTFVAPPSGVVTLIYGGQARGSAAGQYAWISCEVKVGDTIGAGAVMAGATDTEAVVVFGTNTVQATWTRTVTGLTAGEVYNFRQVFGSSSGAASIGRGRVTVIPQL
ncbi:MAG: hypothetical protein ACRCYR_03710 [Phycicoccus sp.]